MHEDGYTNQCVTRCVGYGTCYCSCLGEYGHCYQYEARCQEIIVIGYGAAKAKDLTAPITVVKGEALTAVPSTTPMAALQGKVPGVNIVNNGAPGEGPTVQIRGIGSFSNSKPLFVVDGMFYDNINFLNNADIQEMSGRVRALLPI